MISTAIASINIWGVLAAAAFALRLVVAIGYLQPMCMMIAINPNFPKPFHCTALNPPYLLASGVMSLIILSLMNWDAVVEIASEPISFASADDLDARLALNHRTAVGLWAGNPPAALSCMAGAVLHKPT